MRWLIVMAMAWCLLAPGAAVAAGKSISLEEVYGVRGRISGVQRSLASLGYDPGPADGILGPKTRSAIRVFLKREGLSIASVSPGALEATLWAAINFRRRSAPTQQKYAITLEEALQLPLKLVTTGSGFYASRQGHILTNEHVVNGCKDVRLTSPWVSVSVVATDKASDLALIMNASGKADAAAKFRGGRGIRAGDDIVVMGYPLRGMVASEVNVTAGGVSALAGPRNDRRLFQITAPVQPGNSGGPILDMSGNVVGVVVSKLNAVLVAKAIGDIPQNVNFGISAGTVRAFLDAENVPYEVAPMVDNLSTADVAAKARGFTVAVECWK